MRLFAVSLAVAVLASPVSWASHGGPDTNDPRDWAHGTGVIVTDPSSFPGVGDAIAFDTTTGPIGGVSGTVNITASGGSERFRGRVRCLVIDQHTATLGGDVEDADGNALGERFGVRVTDNRARDDAPIDVLLFVASPATAGNCGPEDFMDATQVGVAVGNSTVHDAE